MALSAHSWRQVQRLAGESVARRLPGAEPGRRRVLSALASHTAVGWRLFVHRDQGRRDRADAVLVGSGGVFAVVVGESVDGPAVVRHVEGRLAGVRGPKGQVLARSAIHYVLVGSTRAAEPFLTLAEGEVERLFRRDPHLDRRHVDAVAQQVAARLADYPELRVSAPERSPEPVGLLAAEDVAGDQLAAAQERPFETWLTFLHPHQQAVATRRYGGPARISGPAGTGKTVVALHRLRNLARRSTGPLLFTTFVRTLPRVHQAAFHRLAPESAHRVEFTNLHSWVRDFLAARDRRVVVDARQARTLFSRAWLAHRPALEELEPSPGYWQTEIDRVIKGRGLRTLQEYLAVVRRGRRVRLDAGQKEKVWRLYETYERFLRDKGVRDHNDLITVALEEIRRERPEPRYEAVVVDEVQDITLTGLRLLRELAGDEADRLLLVGDGQQQVYAGGWRLSDAGIPIQGRGEVLRVNYRNRERVLDFARRFDANNTVDDLDGAAGVTLRQAETVATGGRTHTWTGPGRDLPAALAAAVRGLPVPAGQAAVITFTKPEAQRCASALTDAGIPIQRLEDFTGEADDRLKIGTVHRAKGLDFQGVLVVETPAPGVEPDELRVRQRLVAATRARDYLWWAEVRD
ncbi:UvrD-helicase domain-containing protein [Actinosynnema sp. CS-041913]|uniref:UvrD-helicase domain-containing protein n=1 Tax=Actinosynnema sp. CS-041913 TaxID=3239917 RepID=UPI003D946932